MTRRPLGAAIFTLAASAFGCSAEKPNTTPPSAEARPSPAGGLRPLTSRDEAKPFAAPNALGSGALPAGHPPIGDAPAGKAVAGTVRIAPALASRALPTDILYLIARSHSTKTVVAVRRETSVRFPHAFELSAADAMVADQPFVGPFDITARLSRSGDAIPAPGDLEGTTAGVAEGARTVSVVIEKVRQ